MGFVSEFKTFITKGNVLDLAVAVVIGGAFGKIVSSMVADIIMPIVGQLTAGVRFDQLFYALDGNIYESLAAAVEAKAPIIKYGNFIQTAIDFLIIAFFIFLVVKGVNATKKKEEAKPAAPPAPSKEEVLLTEIRDLLKAGK